MLPRRPFTPVRLTLAYLLAGVTWIVVTDALAAAGSAWAWSTAIQPLKGLLFVCLTSVLLYGWSHRFHGETTAATRALEHARVHAERSRRMHATLSAVNRRIVKPTDAAALMKTVCDALVECGGLHAAWLGAFDPVRGVLTPMAHRGATPPATVPVTGARTADEAAARVSLALPIEATGPDDVRRTREALRPFFEECGARRCATLPLPTTISGPVVLAVYSSDIDQFDAEVHAMLSELAEDVAYGLDTLLERERRTAAEEALRASEERYRLVAENSHDVIWILSLDRTLQYVSPSIKRLLGYTPAEISQLTLDQLLTPESHARVDAELTSAVTEITTSGTMRDRILRVEQIRSDHTTVWTELHAMDFHDDHGKCIGLLGVTRDITERREMEQRLLRSQRLESVGLLASGIAHDLNNVLTPILLSTGLLELRYGGPEDAALLRPIEAAARRGSSIVQQILTFARGAEGERVPVMPKVLLKELSNLIRETFPRNITHRLNAVDTPPVIGDPTQLHQVFLNLAVNARDAMPHGGVMTIEMTRRILGDDEARQIPAAHAGEYVCISIADTGTGMTTDVLDHLFEPFFTTKPRGRGTGLGLSTVHGLVRSHGGFVEVTSRIGQGSAFRVFLPAAAEQQTAATPQPTTAPRRLGRGEYVLVTDDEPAILTVLSSILSRQGFVPLQASDGEEALALLDRHIESVALVITDVMMPRFDGVRLAEEVRRRRAGLPVVAMSGMISPTPEEDLRQQLRDLGVRVILDKPYGEPELLAAIERALEKPPHA